MSKNRNFAKLVNAVDSTGKIANSSAISPSAVRSVERYDSANFLPTSGLQNGDRALAGNKLFISNGSGWYNFSLINFSPRITSGPSGNFIQLDSTAPETISLAASDSDGTRIIWEYITSDSALDLATISSDSNGVFTVTGKSLTDILTAGYDSSGGSFTVTFKASDGIAFDADSATFTLTFVQTYFAPILNNLGTIWTANYTSIDHNLKFGDVTPLSFIFNNDGTKMYADMANTLYEYTLGAPYDMTTLTNEVTRANSLTSTYGSLKWNDNGTRLYKIIIDPNSNNNSLVYQYALTTPYSISSIFSESNIATIAGSGSRNWLWAPDNSYFYAARSPTGGQFGDTSKVTFNSTIFDFSNVTVQGVYQTSMWLNGMSQWSDDGKELIFYGRTPTVSGFSDGILHVELPTAYDLATLGTVTDLNGTVYENFAFYWNATNNKFQAWAGGPSLIENQF